MLVNVTKNNYNNWHDWQSDIDYSMLQASIDSLGITNVSKSFTRWIIVAAGLITFIRRKSINQISIVWFLIKSLKT